MRDLRDDLDPDFLPSASSFYLEMKKEAAGGPWSPGGGTPYRRGAAAAPRGMDPHQAGLIAEQAYADAAKKATLPGAAVGGALGAAGGAGGGYAASRALRAGGSKGRLGAAGLGALYGTSAGAVAGMLLHGSRKGSKASDKTVAQLRALHKEATGNLGIGSPMSGGLGKSLTPSLFKSPAMPGMGTSLKPPMPSMGGMPKTAGALDCYGGMDNTEPWSDKFAGSPFEGAARKLEQEVLQFDMQWEEGQEEREGESSEHYRQEDSYRRQRGMLEKQLKLHRLQASVPQEPEQAPPQELQAQQPQQPEQQPQAAPEQQAQAPMAPPAAPQQEKTASVSVREIREMRASRPFGLGKVAAPTLGEAGATAGGTAAGAGAGLGAAGLARRHFRGEGNLGVHLQRSNQASRLDAARGVLRATKSFIPAEAEAGMRRAMRDVARETQQETRGAAGRKLRDTFAGWARREWRTSRNPLKQLGAIAAKRPGAAAAVGAAGLGSLTAAGLAGRRLMRKEAMTPLTKRVLIGGGVGGATAGGARLLGLRKVKGTDETHSERKKRIKYEQRAVRSRILGKESPKMLQAFYRGDRAGESFGKKHPALTTALVAGAGATGGGLLAGLGPGAARRIARALKL
jgi:hypothetical protein